MTASDRSRTSRQLLLFDHDGVIADSLDVFVPAIIEGCERAGVAGVLSREDVLRLYEGNVYESLAGLGASPEAIREVMDRANGIAGRSVESQRSFPGMPGLLARLAAHRRVVIVSSNAGTAVRSFLERVGVNGVEIAGAEAGYSKAEKVERLRTQHPDQERVWFVTDTAGDVLEARRVGVLPVGVTWGWHTGDLLRLAGAEHLADSPHELLAVVAPDLAST